MRKLSVKMLLTVIVLSILLVLAVGSVNATGTTTGNPTPLVVNGGGTGTTGNGGATTNYTVSFNTSGGSNVSSQTVAASAKATKPTDPTRTGYTFGGWYTDSALTTAYDFDKAVTSNITLYAKWNTAANPNTNASNYQNTDLPKTGDASDYILFAFIGLCVVFAVFGYRRYRNYNI